jgi:hypothetical protein
MSLVSSFVSREIAVDVAASSEGPIRMLVDLRYDTADPFAVQAVFRADQDNEVVWVFARDLLAGGVSAPSGEGDVRIWPSLSAGREVLRIALISPDGEALLQAQTNEIVDFLNSTYALCPWGKESEQLHLDSELQALLAS